MNALIATFVVALSGFASPSQLTVQAEACGCTDKCSCEVCVDCPNCCEDCECK
ncbi:MAG: hypothetical protein ACON38_18345 [Akkermansiaceae bacterium]